MTMVKRSGNGDVILSRIGKWVVILVFLGGVASLIWNAGITYAQRNLTISENKDKIRQIEKRLDNIDSTLIGINTSLGMLTLIKIAENKP